MIRFTRSTLPALAFLALMAGSATSFAQGYDDDYDRPSPHRYHRDWDRPPPWERWHRHHWRDGDYARRGPRREGFGRDRDNDRGRFGNDDDQRGRDQGGQERRRSPNRGQDRNMDQDDRT